METSDEDRVKQTPKMSEKTQKQIKTIKRKERKMEAVGIEKIKAPPQKGSRSKSKSVLGVGAP